MTIIAEESFERIGIIKPDALGDLVLALPAIRSLRRAYPETQIELLVHPGRVPFAKSIKDVNRVVPFITPWLADGRLKGRMGLVADLGATVQTANKLRQHQYDLVVNLRPDMRDALLACLSGARRTLSFDYHNMGRMLTDPIIDPGPEMHESRRLLYLLENVGIFSEEAMPDLPRDGEAASNMARMLRNFGVSDPYIVIHAVAPLRTKIWPHERFIEVADELTRRGRKVVWVGSEGERPLIQTIAEEVNGSINMTGLTKLMELVELLARAEMFIGVDSGPAHLAGPLGIPTLVIFSGTNLSSRWHPLGPMVKVVEVETACRPCAGRCTQPDQYCLTGITSERVIESALSMLRGERIRL